MFMISEIDIFAWIGELVNITLTVPLITPIFNFFLMKLLCYTHQQLQWTLKKAQKKKMSLKKTKKHEYLIHIRSDKAFMGTVVNRREH